MKNKLSLIVIIISLTGAILLGLSFFIRSWLVELFVSFAPQIIVSLFLLIITSLAISLLKRVPFKDNKLYYVLLILASCVLLLDLLYSMNAQTPTVISSNAGETMKFASFNKMFTNGDVNRIVEYVKPRNVDVIAFQEIKESEMKSIAGKLGYKYYYLIKPVSKKHKSSVGIVSKLMVDKFTYTNFGEGYGVLKASARLSSGGNVSFYSTHLMSPLTNRILSDIQIDRLADILKVDNSKIVIGGDFNTTIFSKKIKDFDQKTKNVIKPITTEAWPKCSWFGYGSLTCMRIDQVYISNNFNLKGVEIAPDLGSDHRMIITEIII